VSAEKGAHHNPGRILKQMATKDDFVAWKLDIDHPATEMPLALGMLADQELAELVDEFFFELHFRCEIMTSCGWGKRVPYEDNGMVLNRVSAMEFFLKLRQLGIRAHIWP